MYIGTQGTFKTDTELEVLSQLGVVNVDQTPTEPWTEWSTEMIVALRERFDKFGISLEMMHIPLRGRPAIGSDTRPGQPNSAGIIFLGPSDERDRRGVLAVQLDVEHVRQPGEGMPVAQEGGREGPGDGLAREAGLHVRVVDHVAVVVVVDEVV